MGFLLPRAWYNCLQATNRAPGELVMKDGIFFDVMEDGKLEMQRVAFLKKKLQRVIHMDFWLPGLFAPDI
jgi:hypothetical protein